MGWMKIQFACLCSTSKKDSAAARATRAEQARRPGNRRSEVTVIAADVPELTLRELKKATDKFSGFRLIGRGAHAEVFRATLRGGRTAAAKRLIRRPPAGTDSVGILRQQVAVASRLRHENVVRLLGYNVTADRPVLLYEFAGVGTLHDVLHGPRGTPEELPAASSRPAALRLSWAQRVRIALDAARGLQYLHEAAVAHHHVWSMNVLLFEGLRAKIAGHNVFKELEPPVPEEVAFRYDRRPVEYFPLELVVSSTFAGRPTPKSDVYSFGVVLLELLTGRKSFDDTLPRDQQVLVSWAAPLLAAGRVEECIDANLGDHYPPTVALKLGRIAVQCLQAQQTSRPSMDTVVARLINCDVIMQHRHGVV